MANRCAGIDPTWAHLPTPAPIHAVASHYYSCPSAAFENEALASALRASMAPAHGTAAVAAAKASSFSSPATPSSSTSSASELLSSGHDAPAPVLPRPAAGRPPAARAAAGARGGRVSKRKPRPSRRAPTTYINADPANFRRMVQEITGLPVPVQGASSSFPVASDAAAAAAPTWTPAPAPAYVLPTLDTSAFLLDRPKAEPEDKSSSGGCASPATDDAAGAVPAARDEDSSLLLELDAMMWFPTLESWTGINI